MADKLILTGWGYLDYACAAAAALRKLGSADVRGMTIRRLPEFLESAKGYQKIYLLGIGLSGNPPRLLGALQRLQREKTSVVWISAIWLPEDLRTLLGGALKLHESEADGITNAVNQFFHVSNDDLVKLSEGSKKKESAWCSTMRELVHAAMFFYRNYQDENAYPNAIRQLADGEGRFVLSDSESSMIKHYERYGSRELAGKSETMRRLQATINRVAKHDHARVLITGESGTGKETVALQIHNKSPRKGEPFLAFNCANINRELLEGRLFGYEKGAFTGATQQHKGLFEQANGGTLFLDEIGELPMEAQGLLLRVLEGGRFRRIGEGEEVEVDVRLITATNRDLAARVRDKLFREDLYYRLNVVQIHMPALREHKEDIADIANAYWRKQHHTTLTPGQIEALKGYDYPGNVRELLNLLERAEVLGETDFQTLLTENRRLASPFQTEENEPDALEAVIRRHVKRVYAKFNKNLSQAAKALAVSRNTASKYLKE